MKNEYLDPNYQKKYHEKHKVLLRSKKLIASRKWAAANRPWRVEYQAMRRAKLASEREQQPEE